ncbi:MAG TPA: rhodanese-like domain-containing protein [Candidatus Thermoplasmatota archaeon]|nr:rhodanese-like domain-containing protein [Candidatus Thermoplasmatota archaeon]
MPRASFREKLRNVGRLLFGAKKRAPIVDPKEAQRLHQQGAVVIDVREAGEHRGGHIAGARNVPLAELESRLQEIPRDAPVVVHCALGSRSALAAKRLQALGFENVHDMSGGIRAWKQAGLPVEKDDT